MAAIPHDYSRLFRNLAHMVALSKEEKVAGVVDNLVVTAVCIDPADRIASTEQIVEIIDAYFGLRFVNHDIESAIGRAVGHGRLLRGPNGRIVPSAAAQAEISERIQRAHQLENDVREEWLGSIVGYDSQRDSVKDNELWECLRSYMAQAFRRHGAETILLLNPTGALSVEDDRSLTFYQKEAYKTCCHRVSEDLASSSIRSFFTATSAARSRYIAQLLDGTFSFYAVCVDETTSTYLKTAIKPVAIFLDTNFMFGLLRLHNNPLNQVSEELVEAIQRHEFPFKLYYHERTLEEFQAALNRIRHRLLGYHWTQNLSRAATRTRDLTTIEQQYHEANARRPIDAGVFLTKYEHVEQILFDKGFSIYREPDLAPAQKENWETEMASLIEKYNMFLVDRLGLDKAKGYRTIEHDMTVWHCVKRQRRSGTSALEIGALFLTADHNLFAFDWQRLRTPNAPGHVILPNQLLQLLRPFLVVSTEFDKKFAATFAIPEFRTAVTDYGATMSKVLGYLATFADVSEETATRILANEVLLGRLRDLKTNSAEFREVVDSTLAKDNKELLQENQRLLEQAQSSKSARQDAEGQVQTREQLIARQQQLLQEKESLARRQREELDATTRQLETANEARSVEEARASKLEEELTSTRRTLQQETERRRSAQLRFRTAVACIFWIFGIVALVASSLYVPWLAQHTRKIGVLVCGGLMISGVAWAIYECDRTRRWIAITAVVLASGVSLTQIIDPEREKAPPTPTITPSPTATPR
jgi:hypothetical protein